MKKLLALVLALVMVMSLCITSNAAFASEDIDYKEAVEVMSAIGVLQGDENGKFNPDGTLTREQAAKIICYMLLGAKTAEKLTVEKAPFADVEAGRWSAPFVAYCAANKIVDGIGNGKFDPAGKLTGHAFGKMLLTALGIKGEFTGASWEINVAAALVKNELDEDIETIVLSKELARQEAAQLAFNAVKFNGTEKVYGVDTDAPRDGVANETFDDRTDAMLFANAGGYAYIGKVENVEKSLLDDVFKVAAATGTDKFGRIATVYSNDDWDDSLTFADTAKYSFVATKAPASNSQADNLAALRKAVDKDTLTFAPTVNYKVNGDPCAWDLAATYKVGDKVELYVASTDSKQITTVIVTSYEIDQIDEVTTDLSKSEIKDGASYKITLDVAGPFYDDSETAAKVLNGFDAKTYVEDAYLAVAKNGTGAILDSYVAEKVTGTVTAKDSDYVKANGTKYVSAGSVATAGVSLGSEYDIYTTAEGYVLKFDGVNVTNVDDIYLLAGAYKSTSNKGTDTYYATAVALDGTVSEVVLESANLTHASGALKAQKGAIDGAYTPLNWLVALTDKDNATLGTDAGNDKFDVKKLDTTTNSVYNSVKFLREAPLAADLKTSSTSVNNGAKTYVNDDTKYIVVSKTGDNMKVTTAEGGVNCKTKDAGNAAVNAMVLVDKDATKTATYVILVADNKISGTVSTKNYVYQTKTATEQVEDGYVSDLYFMDGVSLKEDLVLKNNGSKGFFVYDVDDDVYELKTDISALIGALVDDDTDGYTVNATIDYDKIYNKTLTATNYEDVDFSGAKVIDIRSESDMDADAYCTEITTVDQFIAAAKKGDLTADLYVVDGEIVFIAVTAQ